MNPATSESDSTTLLKTLPGDAVREIMWRYSDRADLKALVRSVRGVARGPVARLVAGGARRDHEWTPEKAGMLGAFDEAGVTTLGLDAEHGGTIRGPRNLAHALAAFELAWVDGGAASSSVALQLGLAPIVERGTPEQRETYLNRVAPGTAPDGKPWRAAFALTEPLPNAGVDAGMLSGSVSVEKWEEGEEPLLRVEKRGRFISNMAFANFVTAAVESADRRIQGTCMVILEEGDPGVFDRGPATRKFVHQLAATSDPVFNVTVPASRIVGGYAVKDGVIVPNLSHGRIIETVFRRTRIPVGLMTSAKLLSAVEPLIRYQRERFRGAIQGRADSPRMTLGLQLKEDVLQRLVDVWSAGEAGASLGFAAARLFDELTPFEAMKDEILEKQGAAGPHAERHALEPVQEPALEYLGLAAKPAESRDAARFKELESDPLVQFLIRDVLASVLIPASKLWSTGYGANMMREAVSLLGGYGITEDGPGFLGQKWMDAQLEATYEGPEAVQRRLLSQAMTDPVFLAEFKHWIGEMRRIGGRNPGTGACTLGTAMELWYWTLTHLLHGKDADGKPLYRDHRQGVTFLMADAVAWIVAARYQILDLLELEARGGDRPELAESLPGLVTFFTDLCRVQAARASGEVGRILTQLVYGYNRHPSWADHCPQCYQAEDLEALEGVMAGIAAFAYDGDDVIEADGTHPDKAGPCVRFDRLRPFNRIRAKLDGCLTESQLAKDRAARAIANVEIPEALDYPV